MQAKLCDVEPVVVLTLFACFRPDNASETRDDVPFSCCSIAALAPCVHQGVTTSGTRGDYLYSPERNMTISQDGCHDSLSKRAKTIAWLVAVVLLFVSFYQVS